MNAKDREALDWIERDVLRGTEDPAAWGVPEDYAAGFIAGVHSFRAALGKPEWMRLRAELVARGERGDTPQ